MKKAESGSRRKCDTTKHKKTQQLQRVKRRGIMEEQVAKQEFERVHNEAEFRQRLPDIHVPEERIW